MAIGTGQYLLLRALAQTGHWQNIDSVCELGSQGPIYNELVDLFSVFGKAPLKPPYSASNLYDYLGVSEYTSIDFNGTIGALPFDLNKNLRKAYDYHASFDLVTNFGTTAVVFDQAEVFQNIHQLCRQGGYMIHTLQTQGWGRQWFYKYSANFVEDLAAANDYELVYLEPFLRLKSYFKQERTKSLQHIRTLCDFVESLNENVDASEEGDIPVDLDAQRQLENHIELMDAICNVGIEDALFNITLACILRKNSDCDFVAPILELYQGHAK